MRRIKVQPPTVPYYVADEPLYIDGVRAHSPGDRVPLGHVERYGWAGKVHAPTPQAPKPATAPGQAAPKEND